MNELKKNSFVSILLVLFFTFFVESIYAQFSIGSSYGIQIPGRKDLNRKEFP